MPFLHLMRYPWRKGYSCHIVNHPQASVFFLFHYREKKLPHYPLWVCLTRRDKVMSPLDTIYLYLQTLNLPLDKSKFSRISGVRIKPYVLECLYFYLKVLASPFLSSNIMNNEFPLKCFASFVLRFTTFKGYTV